MLCPNCKETVDGSNHYCFVCNSKTHVFCFELNTRIEKFNSKTLCLNCFKIDHNFAKFTKEQIDTYISNLDNQISNKNQNTEFKEN